MIMYAVTEKQLRHCISAAYSAANEAHSYGDDEEAEEFVCLAKELKSQAIMTEHYKLDEELRDNLILQMFKMGKYLDLLESTLSTYGEADATEMLGNIWKCRKEMEDLLRQKV